MSKKELRDRFQRARKSIDDRKNRENDMVSQVLKDERVIEASTISVFVSFGHEINTVPLIEELLKLNKKVVVPSITPADEMVMKEINSLDDLSVVGKYGIKEPGVFSKVVSKNEIDLVFVPGLAFDKNNYRLGYGKGYYDAYLNGSNAKTIGLGFKEQAIDELPSDSWDIPLDDVLLF